MLDPRLGNILLNFPTVKSESRTRLLQRAQCAIGNNQPQWIRDHARVEGGWRGASISFPFYKRQDTKIDSFSESSSQIHLLKIHLFINTLPISTRNAIVCNRLVWNVVSPIKKNRQIYPTEGKPQANLLPVIFVTLNIRLCKPHWL